MKRKFYDSVTMSGLINTKILRTIAAVAVIAMVVVTLNACLKDDGVGDVNQLSAVRALNAVPGSMGLDIGLDQNQLNDRFLEEKFVYGDTLPYKNAWPGNRLVRVFSPIRNPNAAPLASGTVSFVPGKFYSLYVVGYEDIELLVTEDNLSAPEEGKAKIRFIHLSPDAPALDFGIAGDDDLLASNKAFKTFTDFVTIDADKDYKFDISVHNNREAVHTFEFKPEKDMIYTIWAKGLLEKANRATLGFGHGVITH